MDLFKAKKLIDEKDPEIWKNIKFQEIYSMQSCAADNWAFQLGFNESIRSKVWHLMGLLFFAISFNLTLRVALSPIIEKWGDIWFIPACITILLVTLFFSYSLAALVLEGLTQIFLSSQSRPDLILKELQPIAESITVGTQYEEILNTPAVRDYTYSLSIQGRKYLNIDWEIMQKLAALS